MKGWKRAEKYIARKLVECLIQNCCDNAREGYPDSRFPAPEVFERPGWGFVFVDSPGPLEVAREERPRSVGLTRTTTEPQPDPIKADRVTPYVTAEAVGPLGERRKYGLGFHVDSRRWFVFRTRRQVG